MAFVIKAHVCDPDAETFAFAAQKTMYGGKHIAEGDTIFVFASENEGGSGLVAQGFVSFAQGVAKTSGRLRQAPRVNIEVSRTALAKRPLGRGELKPHADWGSGDPRVELNFKLYRQATDKIVGVTPDAASFLLQFF